MSSTQINTDFKDLAEIEGPDGRQDYQKHWHEYFANWLGSRWLNEHTHLDVGSGLCCIRERYPSPFCQDVGPDLPVDTNSSIFDIEDKFDLVTCFDVLEHIVDDVNFLGRLVHLSNEWTIITTPNYEVSRCQNEYHVREYTPGKLLYLLDTYVQRRCVYYYFGYDGKEVHYHLSDERFRHGNHRDLGVAIHYERY